MGHAAMAAFLSPVGRGRKRVLFAHPLKIAEALERLRGAE